MAVSALRRLMSEYKQLTVNPPEGILAGPISEENFFEWETYVAGEYQFSRKRYGFYRFSLIYNCQTNFDLVSFFNATLLLYGNRHHHHHHQVLLTPSTRGASSRPSWPSLPTIHCRRQRCSSSVRCSTQMCTRTDAFASAFSTHPARIHSATSPSPSGGPRCSPLRRSCCRWCRCSPSQMMSRGQM